MASAQGMTDEEIKATAKALRAMKPGDALPEGVVGATVKTMGGTARYGTMAASAGALAAESAKRSRIEAWRSVFERANRIVSGVPVTVQFPEDEHGNHPAPAWTDGEAISISSSAIDTIEKASGVASVKGVLKLKGLNYHELSHVLFSPRLNDVLPSKVRERAKTEPGVWGGYNALEDQRIETLFSADYAVARRYFEATSLQWLVDETSPAAAAYIHGRKYLPAEIRVAAGRLFRQTYGDPLYAEMKDVVDQFLTVDTAREVTRAVLLIVRFAEVMKAVAAKDIADGRSPEPPSQVISDHGDQHQMPTKGKQPPPAAVRKTKVAAEKIVKQSAEEDAEAEAQMDAEDAEREEAEAEAKAEAEAAAQAEAEAESPAEDGAEGAAQEGEEADDPGTDAPLSGGGEDGEGEPEAGDGDGEADGAGDADAEGDGDAQQGGDEGEPADGAGSTSSDDPMANVADEAKAAQYAEDMADRAKDALEDVMQDEAVVEEAKTLVSTVRAVQRNANTNLTPLKTPTRAPAAECSGMAQRIVGHFRKIRSEVEPEIRRAQATGRLDVARVLAARPGDREVFSSYDEGSEEEAGTELVVLLDVSGSMTNRINEAADAVWTVKRAMDKSGVKCTVICFSTESFVLYGSAQKVKGEAAAIYADGGTNPVGALKDALHIFRRSQMPNKALVTITDGSWNQGFWGAPMTDQEVMDTSEDVVRTLNKAGVVTALWGLDDAVKSYGKHEHQTAKDMVTIKELPKLAGDLVQRIMVDALNRI